MPVIGLDQKRLPQPPSLSQICRRYRSYRIIYSPPPFNSSPHQPSPYSISYFGYLMRIGPCGQPAAVGRQVNARFLGHGQRGRAHTFFWTNKPIRRMATAPTMAKTRMTPGSLAAQFFRFKSVWRVASLRATRDMSIAAISAVIGVCNQCQWDTFEQERIYQNAKVDAIEAGIRYKAWGLGVYELGLARGA